MELGFPGSKMGRPCVVQAKERLPSRKLPLGLSRMNSRGQEWELGAQGGGLWSSRGSGPGCWL